MTKIIEPLKKAFHLLPLKALRRIAIVPGLILFLSYLIQTLIVKTGVCLPDKLPYYHLFSCWNKNGFNQFHEACFDLIHAPISYHFKEYEMLSMAKAMNLEVEKLELVNSTMWSMTAIKPIAPSDMKGYNESAVSCGVSNE
ncbi:hypothetical protein MBAV_003299 [Candidatus Magnetobacterium bavaricum]|uniref:Uncharacterized protein n=1 Tax=Candidatus Magnetobacterium bavaricum TaxID=29290 RepID=A0A0F3GV12_9BACT|nr:hypothetical protein MBAV_003299 [Candidatus Magnetobacterium bavaricum]